MATEYRGCRSLVYAKVLTDTADGMTFGEVKPLAPVQQIARDISRDSKTSYYDNTAANTITSEGAETNKFIIAVPSDEVLADIEGKFYDPATGIYSDTPITDDKYAVGYVLGEKGDEDNEDFCWKNKGTFQVEGTEHNTEDDGTDTTNITLNYTSIYPNAHFAHGGKDGNGGKAKGVRIKKSGNLMTEAEFFAQVQTVDTVYTAAGNRHTLTITQDEDTTVTVTRNGATLTSGAKIADGDVLTISVTGGTITVNGSSFTSGNTHTVNGDVAVVSTAS